MVGRGGGGVAISTESSILLHKVILSLMSLSFFSRRREDLLDSIWFFFPNSEGRLKSWRKEKDTAFFFPSPAPTVAGMLTTSRTPAPHSSPTSPLTRWEADETSRRSCWDGRLGGRSYALHATAEKFLTALSRATPASRMSNQSEVDTA